MDSNKDFKTYNLNLDELDDPLTVSIVGGPTLGYNNTDTITISSPNFGDTSLSSPYTFTGVQGAGFSNTVWTTSSTGTNTPWMTQNPTGARISLTGEDADVEVNGWSLVSAVKRIEQRLGLFQPNPELEAEWADLQQLGEQYRKLEQHIRDKQATFDRIKAMPAPEID